MRRHEEHEVYRGDDKVFIRKCNHCGCWFGTPWYHDEYCCPGCKDAEKRRQKRWPNARKVR